MIDVTPDYLLNVLDEETAKRVWRHLRGVRIYFPKCKSTHDEIRSMYSKMSTSKSDSIKSLMSLFEMSESQIRNIIREQGELFG